MVITMAKVNPPPPLGARPPEGQAASPDLVDRIFQYLVERHPELGEDCNSLKAAVREEFAGDRAHVARFSRAEREQRRHERAQEVLRLFNGRNATEVARVLGLGRATVYRMLKQPGREEPEAPAVDKK
jgi:DNA-binding NtrC family response regulator